MKFLLDTSILSEPLKSFPSKNAMRKLHTYQADIVTAAPVWHEMVFGSLRLVASRKQKAIERYLRTVVWPAVPILPYEAVAAEWHSYERARLSAIGKPPAFVDGQIAAIAKTNDLILVTANVSDFASFQELRIENWL